MARQGLPPHGDRMKFTYTGIEVRDLDHAIEFYTKGLGMTLEGRGKIPATVHPPTPGLTERRVELIRPACARTR